jgi:hypothetical protein
MSPVNNNMGRQPATPKENRMNKKSTARNGATTNADKNQHAPRPSRGADWGMIADEWVQSADRRKGLSDAARIAYACVGRNPFFKLTQFGFDTVAIKLGLRSDVRPEAAYLGCEPVDLSRLKRLVAQYKNVVEMYEAAGRYADFLSHCPADTHPKDENIVQVCWELESFRNRLSREISKAAINCTFE